MKKYCVEITYSGMLSATIEADNREEAIEFAKEDLPFDVEIGEITVMDSPCGAND